MERCGRTIEFRLWLRLKYAGADIGSLTDVVSGVAFRLGAKVSMANPILVSSDLPQVWDEGERASISQINFDDCPWVTKPVMPSGHGAHGRESSFADVLERRGSRLSRVAV
jgi:hypothetical protein